MSCIIINQFVENRKCNIILIWFKTAYMVIKSIRNFCENEFCVVASSL